MSRKPRLVTGLQPSGALHVGNLYGAIMPTVELLTTHTSLVAVVDLHAITVEYEPDVLYEQSLALAATLIAAGLDPKQATLFIQSQVPQHTELAWLLNTLTPLGHLQRMTQFKDKRDQVQFLAAGLLNYPILQAADILLYKGEVVPVGEDQQQHLELTREIARRYNSLFGDTFAEPQTKTSKKASRIMALHDPLKKMSKSDPAGAILLSATNDQIAKVLKRAVTDTGPNDDGPMSPGVANLFTLLDNVSDRTVVEAFRNDYEQGNLRYSELKERLIADICSAIAPIREHTDQLLDDRPSLIKILDEGAAQAASLAEETMREVRQAMGLRPRL